MNGKINGNKSHPDREMMVAYVTGSSSAEGRKVIEDHCLDCHTCRTQLSILLHLIVQPVDEDEQIELAPLLPLGQQAAAQAREIIRQQEKRGGQVPASWTGVEKSRQSLLPILKPALIIVALFAGSLTTYFAWWYQSSEERMLTRVREVYRNTRLLQARVTGGFAHQNYLVTRGPGDPIGPNGVDESQRVALLTEIYQEVHTNPKAATRHILGRLFILQGDLDPAEQQFLLALKESLRDAKLNSDLGALYYERSRRREHEDRELLGKAAEYSSNAVEIDPRLPEAWFNRALCYQQMNLFLQAENDWKQYLTLDSNSAWAEEARENLGKLRERSALLEQLEQKVQAEFQAAEAADDLRKMRELVSRHFASVQNLAMDQIFDKYLAAAVAGETNQADQYLRSLKRIGQFLNEIKGDRFVADAVDFVAHGNTAIKRETQSTRQKLQEAKRQHESGHTGAASDLYAQARVAAERVGDHCHTEIAALGLARYFHHNGESQDIKKLRSQLVTNTERRRHKRMHATALLALANAEGAAQLLSLNLEHSRKAFEIAKELSDTETAINGLRFVGYAYDRLGDRDTAAEKLTEASSLLRNSWVKPILAAGAYDQMGDILFRTGNYLSALPYQLEAVKTCELSGNAMISAYLTQKLGLTYGMLERHDEAMYYLKDAVARADAIPDQIARVRLQIDIYTRFGNFYLQRNKVNEAIATYRRAIENMGQSSSRFHLSSIRQGLATAYMSQGRDAEAETELRESIRLTEEAREQISDARSRSTFLASQQSVYRSMIDFQFFKKNNTAQAFNYAEIAKGRELLDALAGSTEVIESDGQVKLALSRSATPLTLKQVQDALPPTAQLVQFVAGENHLMIWFLTRDRLVTAKSDVKASDLRNKVTAYLDELRAHGNLENLNRQASDLYQWLIAPISRQLDQNRALCIVPDGV
ncbi:MAG: tetratricopeptide repeat protein, partial [Acidobacteria bacterium]|nr:tetratricopeptide repeat protein [Acidobacteriota bacterium]